MAKGTETRGGGGKVAIRTGGTKGGGGKTSIKSGK